MAQIQKGTTYGANPPDNLVTYQNLNSHVDDAELLPGAITEQTTLATTASGDYVLVADASNSYALSKVTLENLIPDSGVATAKLADDAVTNAKLADDAVDSDQIADGAIDPAHLASDAVTTVKIADANVTAAKLAATLDLSGKTITLPDANKPIRVVVTGRTSNGACVLVGNDGVASVTRSAQGTYDVLFNSALASANYNIQVTGTAPFSGHYPTMSYQDGSKTVNGFTVIAWAPHAATLGGDPKEFSILIWRE